MGEPPSSTGPVQDTATLAGPGTATMSVTTPGAAVGTADGEAADGSLVPTALTATTVNEWATPFTRAEMVQDCAGVPAAGTT